MADEQKLRTETKQYQTQQKVIAENLRELKRLYLELTRAEASYAKTQSDESKKRVENTNKAISDVKAQLNSLKLSKEETQKLYNIQAKALKESSGLMDSFSNSVKKLNASLNLPDSKKQIIPKFAVDMVSEANEQLKNTAKTIPALFSITSSRALALNVGSEENKRQKNTLAIQLKLNDLAKNTAVAFSSAAKNEASIATNKFKELSISNLLSQVDYIRKKLDDDRNKLTKGARADMVVQLQMLIQEIDTLENINKLHRSAHEEITASLSEEKERLEIQDKQKKFEEDQEKIRRASDKDYASSFENLLKNKERLDREYQDYVDAERKVTAEKMQAEERARVARQKLDAEEIERVRSRAIKDGMSKKEALDKAYQEYLKNEEDALAAERDAIQKAATARELEDARIIALTRRNLARQAFDEQIAREKAAELERKSKEKIKTEQERTALRERERAIRKIESISSSFISKLPLGGILSMIAALGPMFALLAGLIGIILYFLLRWDKYITDIQKSMGVTRAEAEAGGAAMGKFAEKIQQASIYAPQVAKAVAELSDGLSGTNLLTPLTVGNAKMEEMAAAATVLTDKFQLSGDELGTLTDLSTSMGTSLSGTTIMVEKMAKGSFNVRSMFQSLAKLSPSILTSFRGSNSQLIAMAANAKRLGVEMGDIIESSMSLLDVEDAITKAFEAQVVTGKNIDIDRLMFLQLTGDYGQLLQEQEKILKNADYLNNRSPVFQSMIAGSIGLTQEQASQIALRSLLSDRLGLNEAKIREMQKRGEEVQNVFDAALKQGKITEVEFEELSKIAKEYDFLTIQERIVRGLDGLAVNISSYFPKLTDAIIYLTDKFEGLTKSFSGGFGMGETGKMVMGGIGGVVLAALALKLGGKGFKFARALMPGAALATGAAGAAGSAAGGSVLGTAGAGAAGAAGTGLFSRVFGSSIAQYNTMGRLTSAGYRAGGLGGGMAGMMRAARIGLKPALKSGLIGAGIDFGLGLASGQSLSRAAGGAGFSLAGGVIGGLAGGPVGALIGSTIGGLVGDQVFGNADNAQARMADMQQGNAQMRDALARLNAQQAVSQNPASNVESKIDTTNNLLRELISKPTNVTVELDGEKVGKATMNYASEAMDRGRTIGNTYGQNRDTTAIRPR